VRLLFIYSLVFARLPENELLNLYAKSKKIRKFTTWHPTSNFSHNHHYNNINNQHINQRINQRINQQHINQRHTNNGHQAEFTTTEKAPLIDDDGARR
jgi:hypothetical protein